MTNITVWTTTGTQQSCQSQMVSANTKLAIPTRHRFYSFYCHLPCRRRTVTEVAQF